MKLQHQPTSQTLLGKRPLVVCAEHAQITENTRSNSISAMHVGARTRSETARHLVSASPHRSTRAPHRSITEA
ncbi:MAG: hypothetical protein ACF788_14015, partial [Novipirellula sp. JB048]